MDCAKLCAAHSAGKDWLKFGTLLIRRVNYFVNCWKETLKFHDPKLIAALETFWALPSNAKESDFREMEGEGSGGAARKVLAERTLNFFSANSKEALARGLAVKEKIKFDNALNNLLKSGGDEVTRESLLQAIRKELPALPLQQAQQHLRRSFRHKVNSLRCLGQKVVMELLKVTDGSGAKDPTEQKSAKRRKIADNETSQIPKKQDRCTVERNRSTRCRKPQLQRPWKPSDTFLTCFGFEMLRMPLSLGVRRLSVLLAVSIILGIHRAFSQPELPKEDVLTSADLQRAAKRLNVELRENTAGPWYQIELYSGDRQLGKTSGWAQPWGSLHLETIEVRKFTGYWVAKPANARPGESQSEEAQEATEAEEKKRYADVAKVARWFGLLLSCAIACWNRERSPFYCKEAYLLAIKDEEKQHESLVRYYKGLGFKTIKDPETLEYQDQVLSVGVGVDQMWIRCGTLGLRLDASMENRIPKLLGGQRPKK
eukprot:s972_g29.t1